MHIKVNVIENTSSCQDFSHKHDFKPVNDSFSNYKLLHTLLAENMLGKVKWTTEILVPCHISAMCTEMTKTYDIIIGLRQLL